MDFIYFGYCTCYGGLQRFQNVMEAVFDFTLGYNLYMGRPTDSRLESYQALCLWMMYTSLIPGSSWRRVLSIGVRPSFAHVVSLCARTSRTPNYSQPYSPLTPMKRVRRQEIPLVAHVSHNHHIFQKIRVHDRWNVFRIYVKNLLFLRVS